MTTLVFTKIRKNKWVELFAFFTCGMALCVLQSIQVDGFTSVGHVLVTGPEYDGVSYATTSEDQMINKHIYIGDDGKVDIYCGYLCAETANCSHIEVYGNRCTLILVDLCERYNLRTKPNTVAYDIRSGKDPNRSKTCQRMCMETNSCSECGRGQNCYGNMCQDCKSFCWELDPTPPKGARNYRFFTPTLFYTVTCDSIWHHIWPYVGTSFNPYVPLKGLVLKIRVQVVNSRGESADFVFRDCSVDHGRLTVGRQVSGTANPWNAPFKYRAIFYPTDAKCKPFFYSGDVCLDSTYATARYIWKTNVPLFDSSEVKAITIWGTI